MVFASETFLFLFLPLFLLAYFLTPRRGKNLTILLGSYLFYAWWRIDFLGLLVATTVFTWVCGRGIAAHLGRRRGKAWLVAGLGGNLAVLGTFKYLGFFMDSLAAAFGTTPDQLGFHWQIILPIGVSFYVFQSISYLVDVWRKDAPADTGLIDFAAFIALFPQLIAGPILRFKDLADQFRDRRSTPEMVADGFARFTIGLAKKVLLADAIAPLADLAFTTADPASPVAWLGAVAYMLQLYFDFSGYSDMAIGLGMIMGFRFTENFNTPYVSRSITEFWRRWHISLSVWLRDYLYIPLGGNRFGTARTYFNLWIVMVLGGLWHGANWTFVIWGAWHGTWLALERAKIVPQGNGALSVLRTLLTVLVGWVFFRAADLDQALGVLAGMAGLNGTAIPFDIAVQIRNEALVFLALAIMVAALEPRLKDLVRQWRAQDISSGTAAGLAGTDSGASGMASVMAPTRSATAAASSLAGSLALALLFTACVLRISEAAFTPFLYFQF
ncbi:MBOAT family protein [Thioclava litoralis]|uniref:Probable alginate O-acetylase AlgI n=1 Tax=Thioclava litoralis TaxID=3076557 RepID=A0ABZ1DXP9_9RHOB|nr:MBOAT family protein [Thioclava sp. FTW29]